MENSGKICPVCNNKNEPHALVCIHCGAALEAGPQLPTATGLTPEVSVDWTGGQADITFDQERIPPDGVAIHIVDADKTEFLHIDREIVLGRKVEDSDPSILDLRELGGYQMGLSRRHATIRRSATGYEVIDLASTNGSWMNNQRLAPGQPYALENGSYLKLGRMRILFFFRPSNKMGHS